MSEITRRGFLGSMGAVALGLLFRGKNDKLVETPERPEQAPSAIDIVARPQIAFRPERIVVPTAIASLFVIENITIGGDSRFAQESALSAEMFSADARTPALAMPATSAEIRFRVRYVGKDPGGARFYASIIGTVVDGRGRAVLPIDSGVPIVA